MTEQDYAPRVGDWVEVTIRGRIGGQVGHREFRIGRTHFQPAEDEVVEVKRIDPPKPPLPTEPGIYVPCDNLVRLGQTNTYRLNEVGEWREAFQGRERRAAEEAARYAHENRGGLVRLVPEKQS